MPWDSARAHTVKGWIGRVSSGSDAAKKQNSNIEYRNSKQKEK
jgi:hypothetical protein